MKYGEAKDYWLFYIGRDNGYRTCFYLTYKDGVMYVDGTEYTVDWHNYMKRMQLSESTIGGEIAPEREFTAAIKDGEIKAKYQRNNVEYKSIWNCMCCDWKDHCWKPLIEESKRGKMFYGEEEVD